MGNNNNENDENDEYGWREVFQPLVWALTTIAGLTIAYIVRQLF